MMDSAEISKKNFLKNFLLRKEKRQKKEVVKR